MSWRTPTGSRFGSEWNLSAFRIFCIFRYLIFEYSDILCALVVALSVLGTRFGPRPCANVRVLIFESRYFCVFFLLLFLCVAAFKNRILISPHICYCDAFVSTLLVSKSLPDQHPPSHLACAINYSGESLSQLFTFGLYLEALPGLVANVQSPHETSDFIAHARFSPSIPLVTRLLHLPFSRILGHASLIRDGRG
jgi:hypothetical protein